MKTKTSISKFKLSTVDQIKDLISRSKSIAVVDYKGLKVSQASELRREIKKAGGEMLVTKNTLFKIAQGSMASKIEGTSAYIFSLKDEVSAIKAIADFAKKNQLPTFKAGFLDSKQISASEIAQLASMPDKPTLISKTLGSLKSPLFALTYNLNWNISKLVRTLDAVAKSKGVN